ncbi:MAG: response regulator transcription factor [Lachnospiraceae bacterium]|nr:response regulator transcription factor [Lachnospiraceae bacterium]
MKQILLVEDVLIQAQALKSIIQSHIQDTQITIASNAADALHFIQVLPTIDLFFLDIALSEEDNKMNDGITLGLEIRSRMKYKNTPIIYVTSYTNKIQEAINKVHCFGFLYKPYTSFDVTNLLDSIFQSEINEQILLLKIESSVFFNLNLSSLLFIHAEGKYMTYQTPDSSHTSRQYTLKQLEQQLPSNFIRCHKSYIVNKDYIKNFDTVNHYIQMYHTSKLIPVARTFQLQKEN